MKSDWLKNEIYYIVALLVSWNAIFLLFIYLFCAASFIHSTLWKNEKKKQNWETK